MHIPRGVQAKLKVTRGSSGSTMRQTQTGSTWLSLSGPRLPTSKTGTVRVPLRSDATVAVAAKLANPCTKTEGCLAPRKCLENIHFSYYPSGTVKEITGGRRRGAKGQRRKGQSMLLRNFRDGQNLRQCGEPGEGGMGEGGCELSPDPCRRKAAVG